MGRHLETEQEGQTLERGAPMITSTPIAPIDFLRPFMSRSQRCAVLDGMRGEEQQYFVDKMAELAAIVAAMPPTYGTGGVADPTAHLHYFVGGCDWYITERDSDPDGLGQVQAFGLANLGFGGEMGYISIPEIIANGGELDFHFTPRPLSQVQAS